ncbi:MAG: hypothetical protein AAF403_08500, partial [Pseudomonadota bacterium]
LLDVGLDTFPSIARFTVMELMAKAKPVLSINANQIETGDKEHRLNECVFDDEDALTRQMIKFAEDRELLHHIGLKSKTLIESTIKEQEYYDIIEQQIDLILEQKKILP